MKQDVPLIFCMLHFDNDLTKIRQEKIHRKKQDHRSLALQFSFNRTENANVYQTTNEKEKGHRGRQICRPCGENPNLKELIIHHKKENKKTTIITFV